MKIRLIGLILGALFLLALGTTKTIFVSNKQHSDTIYSREWDSLAVRAQKAKAQGKKRVIFPAPIPMTYQVNSLKEAVSTFKAVRARLIKHDLTLDIIDPHGNLESSCNDSLYAFCAT